MPWGCLAQNIVMSGCVKYRYCGDDCVMLQFQRRIRDLTIKYLDLNLPLSRQPDKLLVEEVIIKVSEKKAHICTI